MGQPSHRASTRELFTTPRIRTFSTSLIFINGSALLEDVQPGVDTVVKRTPFRVAAANFGLGKLSENG